MKSLKNHISLVIALLSILFSIQVFAIVDRSINAYKDNLSNNYSIVVVSQKIIDEKSLILKQPLISSVTPISPDDVIEKLNSGIKKKDKELLKVSLPKFYKLKLSHYPSPSEIENLTKQLLSIKYIMKVETFSKSHDTVYKLLLLFKNVILVFAFSIGAVTILLIFKELKIWQFKHNERMSIMALFGAPVWLRSAVLFRLAIVDAIIATFLAFLVFIYLDSNIWIQQQLSNIGINIVLFDKVSDLFLMLIVAITLSIMLATLIVIGHKEEV